MMHYEPKYDKFHSGPFVMPFLSIPTGMTRPHAVRPDEQPPSTTTMEASSSTDFVLGIDTCGFTTSSTITCDFGYECTNVGNFRGCCLPGAEDCVSTIYTKCIDYGSIDNSAECYPHTLCCPEATPSCFMYVGTTDDLPGATFTHVECNPSHGYGEMFPFPLDTTTTTSTDSSTSSTDTPSDPSNLNSSTAEPDNHSTSHSSTPVGAIVGGVVGGVAFIALILIAAILILRRRRRNRTARKAIPLDVTKSVQSSSNASPIREKEETRALAAPTRAPSRKKPRISVLRPLSLTHDRPNHTPIATSAVSLPASDTDRSAAAAAAARRSFGPNWPFKPNPLAAHPVDTSLKRRSSDSRIAVRRKPDINGADPVPRLPMLRFPTPPPPGTKLAPPPVKSPRDTVDTSAAAALQSPRLSYVPVSPIETVAFGSDADRRMSRLFGEHNADNGSAPDSEPVSPIGSEDERAGDGEVAGDAPRLSYISVPSTAGEGNRGHDELVSPVGPREAEGNNAEGREIPETVSPLDSPRTSSES